MNDSPDVILLRSADEPDRYLEAFAAAGMRAVCEPVLAFAFPNQDLLADRLTQHEEYGALLATSPRVATALGRLFEERADLMEAWRGRTAYAVGPKTARRLREVGLTPEGEEAGDAASLAARLIADEPATPLLFLCGNRRRETIPNRLEAADIPYDELVVYETNTRRDLTLPSSQPARSSWLVFFSPSGLEAVERAGVINLSNYRVAAIGPTTGGALDEAGYDVEAVAGEPSPGALVSALTSESA